MAKTLYTAEAKVTGGRDHGHGKTTDGALEVDLRVPEEMGGDGGFALSVELDVKLPSVDDADQAAEIVAGAHEVCPYSHATARATPRGPVR